MLGKERQEDTRLLLVLLLPLLFSLLLLLLLPLLLCVRAQEGDIYQKQTPDTQGRAAATGAARAAGADGR